MKENDVIEAAELYRMGVLNLRAAVWALARFRRQKQKRVTASEVMERFGASRTNAYRVVSEVNLALDSIHKPVPETGTDEPPETDSEPSRTHQPVPETGIPGFPETGTEIPGNRDSIHIRYSESSERERYIGEIPGFRETGTGLCDGLERARRILAENLQAEPLSGYLSRNAHLPEVRALAECDGDGRYPAGWRLESAALKFLSPRIPENVRSCRDCRASLNYLLSIARGLTEPYTLPSLAPTGTANGSPSAPRSTTDRRLSAMRAETDAWEIPE